MKEIGIGGGKGEIPEAQKKKKTSDVLESSSRSITPMVRFHAHEHRGGDVAQADIIMWSFLSDR